MELLKQQGTPLRRKPLPRFSEKWSEIFRDALRHNINAVGALQKARDVTEKRLAEVEKAINS